MFAFWLIVGVGIAVWLMFCIFVAYAILNVFFKFVSILSCGPFDHPATLSWDAKRKSVMFVDTYKNTILRWDSDIYNYTVFPADLGSKYLCHNRKHPDRNGTYVFVQYPDDLEKFYVNRGGLLCEVTWDGASKKIDSMKALGKEFKYPLTVGKLSPSGKLFVGTSTPTGKGQLCVFRTTADKECSNLLENVTDATAMCWSQDKKVFYFIDGWVLWTYDYDKDHDTIKNGKIMVDFKNEEWGKPTDLTTGGRKPKSLWVTAGPTTVEYNIEIGEHFLQGMNTYEFTSLTFNPGATPIFLYITTSAHGAPNPEKWKGDEQTGYLCHSEFIYV